MQLIVLSYDFRVWTSFPSSRKIENEKAERKYYWATDKIPVTPGAVIKWTIKGKQENISLAVPSAADLHWINAEGKSAYAAGAWFPGGTFDWRPCAGGGPWKAPAEARFVRVLLCGAGGTPKGITWFDDLLVYQDDVLIYSNDFSNWDPVIGAGVGAPVGGVAGYLLKEPLGPVVSEAVGAVLGGALGGGIGLLTGLGIIPVPQIPALEAAPEGPGAPARLGKYQITG